MRYNHLNSEAINKISKFIKFNKTIIGMHFEGNSGYIDSDGFLRN